jgi:hypothetical protein
MKKYFKFTQDLYHQDFGFLTGWKRSEILEYFEVDVSGVSAGVAFVKNGVIYIWIKDIKLDTLEYLTHECLHAANFLFAQRGQEISVKNDEAQAYLVQWIFAQCFACIKKKLK